MEELTIKKVAELTQLSEFTLRAWEKRYVVVKPRRTASRYRIYQPEDVEKLKLLKLLVDTGHSIGRISKLSRASLLRLQREQAREDGRAPKQEAHLKRLLDLLMDFNLQAFKAMLRSLQMQLDTRSFLFEIVAPFLKRIGQDVSSGKLDICHEHAASAILRNVLSGILYLTEQTLQSNSEPEIVITTLEKDLHEFGILICAIVAMLNGHSVLYLGPNLPVSSIAKACRIAKAPILLLGASAPAEIIPAQHFRELISEVAAKLPVKSKIWIGGPRAYELQNFRGASAKNLTVLEDFAALERLLTQI